MFWFMVAVISLWHFNTISFLQTFDSTPLDNGTIDCPECCPAKPAENCNQDEAQKEWFNIAIVFIGILLIGVGNACTISFGIPYMDDNTSKKNTPFAMSLAWCGRLVGPLLGNLIGYFTLKVYVHPGHAPEGIIHLCLTTYSCLY